MKLKMRVAVGGFAMAACLALSSLFVSTPAAAATPDSVCTYHMRTHELRCYKSETEVDASLRTATAEAAGTVVQAKLYDWINYQKLLVTLVSDRPCTTATDDFEGFDDFRGLGSFADNAVSSVQTFNHCDVKLYDGYGYTGDSSRWFDNCAHLGNFTCTTENWYNRAGSLKIS